MEIPAPADLAYEEAYKRLEDVVAELSAGGLSLEEALGRFEQGMALAQYCSDLLDRAELRVQQLGQLGPEELAALLGPDIPAAPAARPGARPNPRPAEPAPRAPEPAASRGPLAGPPPGVRRGTGPAAPPRKPAPGEPLDPLFDDI